MLRYNATAMFGLILAMGAGAEVREIGPWIVESYSDDFSFSALGSMITVERGFDRSAGVPPHVFIIGCDADPERRFEIRTWIVRDGYYEIDSGEEREIGVHASFDDAPAIEQRWIIFSRRMSLASIAPYEVNDMWFEALAGASSLKITFEGDPGANIDDRVVEFDVGDFSAAYETLTCGTDEDQ